MSTPDWYPNFFWVGPQKSASTWAYRCFQEHPEIYVPPEGENLKGIGSDELQFYTIHYEKGISWYRQFYEGYAGEKIVGDTTSSYFRFEKAASRIAQDVPDAKILMCLRNPIDRAYSHFWHEKKKRKISFQFEEVLENYDLFANWIEPGFYASHMKRFRRNFPDDQLLVLLLDDLIEDDRQFIQRVFEFLGAEENFEPSVLSKQINRADYPRTPAYRAYQSGVSFLEATGVKPAFEWVKKIPGFDTAKSWVFGSREYERGIDGDVRDELIEIFKPEIVELEELLNRDLEHWLE